MYKVVTDCTNFVDCSFYFLTFMTVSPVMNVCQIVLEIMELLKTNMMNCSFINSADLNMSMCCFAVFAWETLNRIGNTDWIAVHCFYCSTRRHCQLEQDDLEWVLNKLLYTVAPLWPIMYWQLLTGWSSNLS